MQHRSVRAWIGAQPMLLPAGYAFEDDGGFLASATFDAGASVEVQGYQILFDAGTEYVVYPFALIGVAYKFE